MCGRRAVHSADRMVCLCRRIEIVTGKRANALLSDARAAQLIETLRPQLRRGDVDEGLASVMESVVAALLSQPTTAGGQAQRATLPIELGPAASVGVVVAIMSVVGTCVVACQRGEAKFEAELAALNLRLR